MSRETEKIFKEMHKYLDSFEHGAESKEELNDRIKAFIEQYNSSLGDVVTEETASTSDDFLELAEAAEDDRDALRYAQKAVALDQNNLDAEMKVAVLTSKDALDFLERVRKIVDHGRRLMEEKGYMTEDSIGDFWGITETRPFIRCLLTYADTLKELGMIRQSIGIYREIIHLNTNDNAGARFVLMHLYALMEDEEPAVKLLKQYPEDETAMMLLPMSILYFKLGDFNKSEDYLRRTANVNRDTKRFIRAVVQDKLDQYADSMSDYGYRPGTIEELITELLENQELFSSAMAYMTWANEKLKKKRK